MENDYLDTMLFVLLDNKILFDCGDGWAYVVSPRWQELANHYARISPNRVREDNENFIMFSNDQEGITFLPSTENLPAYDTLVRWA